MGFLTSAPTNHRSRRCEPALILSTVEVMPSESFHEEASSDNVPSVSLNTAASLQSVENGLVNSISVVESCPVDSSALVAKIVSSGADKEIDWSAPICMGRCVPSANIPSRITQHHQRRASWLRRWSGTFSRLSYRCASADLAKYMALLNHWVFTLASEAET